METQFKKSSKQKRAIQKKTFTAWASSIPTERNGSSSENEDLFESLRNGQLLGKLIKNLSGEKVRHLSTVKSREHSIDNVEICLDFLEKKHISTIGIDSEDIVDGCPDTTLELMWAIFTGLYINKKELLKKEEKKTVEEALLRWAQEKTKGYRDVRVKDFTSSSWKDGLAFLALINAHRPNLIHFKDFHNDKRRHNLKTAFDKAEDELGIPPLLDIEDMMKSQVDERSVTAYVACFYKRFADKRRRRSRSESRSDDSDTSSSSEASHSGGDRTERKRRSRSSSKTRRSSRNQHKQRESSQSRSSSSSSKSSNQCKGRRRLKKESERGHNSGSTASSSSERTNIRRGSKNRGGRVGSSKKSTIKCNSPEQNSSDGKIKKRAVRQRSTDRSLSKTRNRRDRRSHSCESKHSSHCNLSRTRNRRDRRSHSRESKHNSDRSPSQTRRMGSYSNSSDQSGVKSKGNWGRYERSPGWSRNKNSYKEDFHARERRNCSWSSGSQDDEYDQTGGSHFHTLSKKQRSEKYFNSNQPTLLDDLSQIRKEIHNLKMDPCLSRNDNSQSEDMDSIKKYFPIKKLNSQTVPLTVPFNPSQVQFEWQFQDEHGAWISYGKPNSAGDASNATTTCSDDIERHFASNITNPDSLIIKSNNNTQYLLDFVNMTQTNQNTSVQRPIRRIKKQPPNITPVNLSRGFNLGAVFNPNILHEWQFEDEHGSWITYGKPNSAGNVSHITTTCSDDIEIHYVRNPANLTPLTINSKNNAQYVLDFKNLTQTNQQTSVQRKIRRVPKASSLNTAIPKGSTFVWSFKDEHGNWIKYGETSSSNDATSATTTTSDDIETKYARNRIASLEIASGHHKYIIDFNAMTQTNINTKAVRAIRRQLVTPSDLPSNWTPMNASDKGLRVVALNATDTEYINQVAFVKKTLPSHHTITKVFRIQNEHLWNDFVSRKKRLKRRNPQINYKEVYLFHGTDPKHVQSICEENLDFRLNGTNGTLHGKGTYFATSAAISASFAGRGATKLMFIVKVLIGHYTVGNTHLRRPPKDASGVFYDTTVDNQANPTVYVKYDNTEYYPEYYIEFT